MVLVKLSLQLSPKFQKLIKTNSIFFKLEADESSTKVDEFGIKSIPTIIIFKDGQEIERFSGVQSKQNLINILESKLTDNFNTNEDF